MCHQHLQIVTERKKHFRSCSVLFVKHLNGKLLTGKRPASSYLTRCKHDIASANSQNHIEKQQGAMIRKNNTAINFFISGLSEKISRVTLDVVESNFTTLKL